MDLQTLKVAADTTQAIVVPTNPNLYAVWITLITFCGPPLLAMVSWYMKRKLGEIHTLVNGNLHAAQQKIVELRAKLVSLGHDPDA